MTTAQESKRILELVKETKTRIGPSYRAIALRELSTLPSTKEGNDAIINAITDEDDFVQVAAVRALKSRLDIPRIYKAVEDVATGWQPIDWRAQEEAQNIIRAYWSAQIIMACE